jgi:hypothetical protein
MDKEVVLINKDIKLKTPFNNDEWLSWWRHNKEPESESFRIRTFNATLNSWLISESIDPLIAEINENLIAEGVLKKKFNKTALNNCRKIAGCLLLATAELQRYEELKDPYYHGYDGIFGFIFPTTDRKQLPERQKQNRVSESKRSMIVNTLVRLGYLEFYNGGSALNSFQSGRMSLVVPLESFYELCSEVLESSDCEVFYGSEPDVIRLQEVKKGSKDQADIDYKDTGETNRYRKIITERNTINNQHSWVVNSDDGEHGGKITKDRLRLDRRFKNGSFTQYGRMHCSAQNIPSKLRHTITIDGEQTVTVDYRSMLVNVAYGIVGQVTPDEDPYFINGIDREVVKGICMRLFNSDSGKAARHKTTIGWNDEAPLFDSEGESDRVFSLVEEKHNAVSELFYAGRHHELLYRESKILFKVISAFNMTNEALLPIHDAILVKVSSLEHAKVAMEMAFKGSFNFTPKLSIEYGMEPLKIPRFDISKTNPLAFPRKPGDPIETLGRKRPRKKKTF